MEEMRDVNYYLNFEKLIDSELNYLKQQNNLNLLLDKKR